MKRAFDIVVATLCLLLLAPVFAIVAVAIKLGSRGPVFFRQKRVGRGGQSFRIVKFRTMISGAESRGPNVSGIDDHRITRVGAFLRRSFLDEAPQLFNVLAGDMSLVGPRPETPEYAALMSPIERRILSVRPGMAGPSTLAYSVQESALLSHHGDPDRYYREHLLHKRLEADLEYLGTTCLREDMRILLRTGAVVIEGLGVIRRRRTDRAVATER